MIERKTGDILAEEAEAVINTVNCVGVMGRGIALKFKRAFPYNFDIYKKACEKGEVQPGKMLVVETGEITGPKYIINFPTKRHWRANSRLDDIDAGLVDLQRVIHEMSIKSIAIPPLGCGNGGLNWDQVLPRITNALEGFADLRVVIFDPIKSEEPHKEEKMRTPEMNQGRASLISLANHYHQRLMEPFVTLLEVHKLLYFMKISGEDSLNNLKFVKETYGPFSPNLSGTLSDIEGHYVRGYEPGKDDPESEIEIIPRALDDAKIFLYEHPQTQARIDRVADLIEGFESSFGLELLSTVHWVIANESPAGADDLIEKVYAWNAEKRRFSRRQINLAAKVLEDKKWVGAGVSGLA